MAHLTNVLPQALLLVGPEHAQTLELTNQVIKGVLCDSENKPCGQCRHCLLIEQEIHPDVLLVTQEKAGSAIKIDQIRNLQLIAYQTPQCATERIVIIHPANELNRAASNALLKILEEPPQYTYFILVATHLDTLPLTIISRCQVHQVSEPKPVLDQHIPGYLNIGLHYDKATPRGFLFENHQAIIKKVCDLSEKKISLCQLASECSNHALSDLLWFFQLFTATLLQYQLLPSKTVIQNTHVQKLAEKHSPIHYFKQLDNISAFTKKMNQDIPLNPTLTLESLLIGYI